jgi:hypothetical protein
MSQPVKLSDELVLDARLVGEIAERSIAGQIEFWAALGRAVEPLLNGATTLALRKSGNTRPLSELLASVDDSDGRRRVVDYLALQPFPRYEPAVGRPGWFVRIEAEGRRTVGKFIGRRFQSEQSSAATESSPQAPPKKNAQKRRARRT